MFKIVSPILAIALAGLIFFFFAKPLFAEIETIQQETTEYREAVEKAEAFNEFLQDLIETRNSFSAQQLQRLETLVPQEVDEVRALVDLKVLAESHGLLFGNIRVQERESSGSTEQGEGEGSLTVQDFDTTRISFGVIGSYEQMRAFLKDIERSLVLMEVVGLNFGATEGELNMYNFSVQLHAIDTISGN